MRQKNHVWRFTVCSPPPLFTSTLRSTVCHSTAFKKKKNAEHKDMMYQHAFAQKTTVSSEHVLRGIRTTTKHTNPFRKYTPKIRYARAPLSDARSYHIRKNTPSSYMHLHQLYVYVQGMQTLPYQTHADPHRHTHTSLPGTCTPVPGERNSLSYMHPSRVPTLIRQAYPPSVEIGTVNIIIIIIIAYLGRQRRLPKFCCSPRPLCSSSVADGERPLRRRLREHRHGPDDLPPRGAQTADGRRHSATKQERVGSVDH